jgi:RNA polymerase sigma-54 factor
MTFTEAKQEIEEIIYSYLPEECGPQKTIFEAMNYSMKAGGKRIRPMLMREVAEEAGINGSTVSRAVQGKYIMYRKTELLRDFFSGKAIEGSEVSGREIRNILADMIRKEDRENPLSDMQIVEEMEKQGISISRRTVNKYRKLMGIPDSRHRI